MNHITINRNDVGVVIRATLTFVDFDPTDATAALLFTGLALPPEARAMDFDGVSIATYTIRAGDFLPRPYLAQVKIAKGGVVIDSEQFQILVT